MSDFADRMNRSKLPEVNGQKINGRRGDILYFFSGQGG